MGGIALMRELIPLDIAKEITLTGRIMSGNDAKAFGLVTHVSKEPLAHALSIVEEISIRSPDAVGAGKRLLQQGWRASDWIALCAERLWQRRMMSNTNQKISVQRNQLEAEVP